MSVEDIRAEIVRIYSTGVPDEVLRDRGVADVRFLLGELEQAQRSFKQSIRAIDAVAEAMGRQRAWARRWKALAKKIYYGSTFTGFAAISAHGERLAYRAGVEAAAREVQAAIVNWKSAMDRTDGQLTQAVADRCVDYVLGLLDELPDSPLPGERT